MGYHGNTLKKWCDIYVIWNSQYVRVSLRWLYLSIIFFLVCSSNLVNNEQHVIDNNIVKVVVQIYKILI